MREWLCKIICRHHKDAVTTAERAFEDDLEQKIIRLKRRIAAAQSSHAMLYGSYKNTQTPTKPVVVATARSTISAVEQTSEEQQKNRELNDLRAKLMGRKK